MVLNTKEKPSLQIACGIQKYFEIEGRVVKLLSDRKFVEVKNTVSNMMKDKVRKCIGINKKQSEVISKETDELLWDKG